MMKKFFVSFLLLVFCAPIFASEPQIDEYWNIPIYADDTNIDWFEFGTGYYQLDGTSQNNAAGLNPGDWRAFNTNGTEVLGTSTCNQYDKDESFMAAAETNGKQCWCKILATTDDIKKKTPTKWIYRGEFRDTAECANLCTYRCSYNFVGDPDFRGEIFNK